MTSFEAYHSHETMMSGIKASLHIFTTREPYSVTAPGLGN